MTASATEDGDRVGMHRRRRLAVLVPLVVALVVAAVVMVVEPPHRTDQRTLYTIEPGTGAKVAAGLPIDEVLPPRLETRVGEALVVRNEDVTSHVFGPFVLAPGQSWSQRFAMDGEYEMVCSLYPNVDLVIDVDAASDPPRAAAVASRAWAAAWVLAVALLSAWLGIAIVGGVGARSPEALFQLTLAVLGGAIGLVALEIVALSRIAPVRDALTSRGLPLWMALLASAAAAALLAWIGVTYDQHRLQVWLGSLGAVVVAVATGLWTALGTDALGASLAVVGAAMLLGSTLHIARHPEPSAAPEVAANRE